MLVRLFSLVALVFVVVVAHPAPVDEHHSNPYRNVTTVEGRSGRRTRELMRVDRTNQQIDLILGHLMNDWLWFSGKRVPIDHHIPTIGIPRELRDTVENLEIAGGWVYDVTTLRRVGDASATRHNGVYTVTGSAGWTDLTLGFDTCNVQMFGMVFQADVRGKIESNIFETTYQFENVNGECETSLVDFKIIEFSDIKIKVNGFGSFNSLVEDIVHTAIDSRRRDIMRYIEMKLKALVRRELPRIKCDEYASLLQIEIV